MENFKIRGEFIELIRLLKAVGLAENGADAQSMVVDKQVKVDGALELRKRAKIKPGSIVETNRGSVKVE